MAQVRRCISSSGELRQECQALLCSSGALAEQYQRHLCRLVSLLISASPASISMQSPMSAALCPQLIVVGPVLPTTRWLTVEAVLEENEA